MPASSGGLNGATTHRYRPWVRNPTTYRRSRQPVKEDNANHRVATAGGDARQLRQHLRSDAAVARRPNELSTARASEYKFTRIIRRRICCPVYDRARLSPVASAVSQQSAYHRHDDAAANSNRDQAVFERSRCCESFRKVEHISHRWPNALPPATGLTAPSCRSANLIEESPAN
jgi:hypothetical protein